ncbi:MAG: hypothetical protein AAF352_05370, partial [Pseudomonadota bacterium]
IAAQLGADVCACLYCGTIYARSIGDQVEVLRDLPSMHILLVNPNIAIATKEVYAAHEIYETSRAHTPPELPENFQNVEDLCAYLTAKGNDLQETVSRHYPVVQDLLHHMKNQPGAHYAAMSGSGSTCFAIFTDTVLARDAEKYMRKQQLWTCLTRTTDADYAAAHILAEGIAFS